MHWFLSTMFKCNMSCCHSVRHNISLAVNKVELNILKWQTLNGAYTTRQDGSTFKNDRFGISMKSRLSTDEQFNLALPREELNSHLQFWYNPARSIQYTTWVALEWNSRTRKGTKDIILWDNCSTFSLNRKSLMISFRNVQSWSDQQLIDMWL